MLGKNFTNILKLFKLLLISIVIVILNSSVIYADNIYNYTEKNMNEFSKSYIDIPYIEGVQFVPKYLSDEGQIIGEGKDINTKDRYLMSINIKNNKVTKLKKLITSSEFVAFAVHGTYGNNIIFEEFDQMNKISTYFNFNSLTKKCLKIHQIKNITPVHYTQWVKQDDKNIIFNFYNSDKHTYNMYKYSIEENKTVLIEERNSSHPIFIDQHLYYIVIDNITNTTKIIKNNLLGDIFEISSLKAKEKFFFGLYTDGRIPIKLIYNNDIIEVSSLNEDSIIYKSSWMETINYENGYISFLGDKLTENRIKPQYFMLDIRNKINYKNNDGMILMSKSGVLWIKFKKQEKYIEKGQVFDNNNSIMRYFEFKK